MFGGIIGEQGHARALKALLCAFSPWGPFVRCRAGLRHHHVPTLSLTRFHGHKVISIAVAASIPELSAFSCARVKVEADLPFITGALITRHGAHIPRGWKGRRCLVLLRKNERKSKLHCKANVCVCVDVCSRGYTGSSCLKMG